MPTEPPTTLPPFDATVTASTTPAPEPKYPLPKESLLDVRFRNTANHHWIFEQRLDSAWITDKAPKQNSLSEAIAERVRMSDPKLTQPGPIKDDVTKPDQSIFVALNGASALSSSIQLEDSLSGSLGRSVVLRPDDADRSCIKLVDDLVVERFYLRQCLLSASECDYGLSISIWMQFLNESNPRAEAILSTGPERYQGFVLQLKNGNLHFELRTSDRTWEIDAPFEKKINQWVNLAVTWGKSTESLKLYVNRVVVAQKDHYTGTKYGGSTSEPRSLWLGCTVDTQNISNQQTMTTGMKVSSVTLWYWPIQNAELLTGGEEINLLTNEEQITTTEPARVDVDYKDYTNEVEDFVPYPGQMYPDNPVYTAADFYHSMQASLDPNTSSGVERYLDQTRNMYAYRLTNMDAYVKLNCFPDSQCPGSWEACKQGLSLGLWANIPSRLDAQSAPIDIVELAQGIRVALYQQTLNIFVSQGTGVRAYRVVEVAPRDTWFNLGVAIERSTRLDVRVYFNAHPMQVLEVSPPTKRKEMKSGIAKGCLLFGSAGKNTGAVNVSANDLILWFHALQDIEKHMFVGYTRSQLASLSDGSYYWTPDLYILRDSDAQILIRRKYGYFGSTSALKDNLVPGYSLASLYQAKNSNFRLISIDFMGKSMVPTFEMRPSQYILLGRTKSAQVSLQNLLWSGHCLHDPSASLCGTRGFTLSMWVKILSTSNNRLRFYLNSGDPGPSTISLMDNRGLAIFTDASLLGVSVSQQFIDWKIVLDSNTYKVGTWVNIGILWRADSGLTLLVDGICYATADRLGTKVVKELKAPPYVVVGRFNDDDQSTWLSPSQAEEMYKQSQHKDNPAWETSHFALGEICYFDKLLTINEYNKHFGLLGISRFRFSQDLLWHGTHFIDPPISDLLAAKKAGLSPPGVVVTDNPYSKALVVENLGAVQLVNGSSVRLGPLSTSHCTRQTNFCPQGISIGGWLQLGGVKYPLNAANNLPIILFTGMNGKYGLTISQNGEQLGGWIQITDSGGVKEWWCQTSPIGLLSSLMNMQWVHYALVWDGTDMHLMVNGATRCKHSSGDAVPNNIDWVKSAAVKAKQLFSETLTDPDAYILMSSNGTEVGDGSLTVAVMTFKPFALTDSNIADLMGIDYKQLQQAQFATYYWPMSGLIRQLDLNRIHTSHTTNDLDSYGAIDGSICTDGSAESYVSLYGNIIDETGRTNLESSCVLNPGSCKTFVLVVRFRLRQLSTEATKLTGGELLRTTSLVSPDKVVGFQIQITPDGEHLQVIARNEFRTLSNSVPLEKLGTLGKWITLMVYYTEDYIEIKQSGEIVAAAVDCTSLYESNEPLQPEDKLNARLLVGHNVPLCISDLAIYETLIGGSLPDLIGSHDENYCYEDHELLLPLSGTETDQYGSPNVSSALTDLVNPFSLPPSAECLYDPALCQESGFALSLWMNISGFSITDRPISSVIFTSGPPAYRGVSLSVSTSNVDKNGPFDLNVSVQTGSEIWNVVSAKSISPDTWTNIALQWHGQMAGKYGSLQLFIDGRPSHSSTVPAAKLSSPTPAAPSKQILFGRLNEKDSMSINGKVHHFSFWDENIASCDKPRQSKKLLTGACSTDDRIGDSQTCTVLGECRLAFGVVCLDDTISNLQNMASQAERFNHPRDLTTLLQLSLRLIRNISSKSVMYDGSEKIIQAVVTLLQRWPIAVRQACVSSTSLICVETKQERDLAVGTLMEVGAVLSQPQWHAAWKSLLELNKVSEAVLADAMSNAIQALSMTIDVKSKCMEKVEFKSDVGKASAIADKCGEGEMQLTSNSILSNGDIGTAEFIIHLKKPAEKSKNLFYLTAIGLPATQGSEDLVAGALKPEKFTTNALRGDLLTQLDNTNPKSVRALNSPSPVLRINSPVFMLDTSQNLQSSGMTLLVDFWIQLSRWNEYHDEYFYRTTGRRRWASIEAIQSRDAGEMTDLALTYAVRCVHWNTDRNSASYRFWDDSGCQVIGANLSHVHCLCEHNSIFAIGMEPENAPGRKKSMWIVWGIHDEHTHLLTINLILLVANGLSVLFALILSITLIVYLVRAVCPRVYILHTITCITFLVLHLSLFLTPWFDHSAMGCRVLGLVLNISGVFNTSWLFCEAIALFRGFVMGDFKSNRIWNWLLGLLVPSVAVVLPTALSRIQNYGDDLLCLPGHESYVFWIMFGTMFANLICAHVVCLIVGCNIETPAFMKANLIEKLLDRTKRFGYFLIYSSVAWIMLVISTILAFPYLPYVAYAFVSLEGAIFCLSLGTSDLDLMKLYIKKFKEHNAMVQSAGMEEEPLENSSMNDGNGSTQPVSYDWSDTYKRGSRLSK